MRPCLSAMVLVLGLAGCTPLGSSSVSNVAASQAAPDATAEVTLPGGLGYTILNAGKPDGAAAKSGDTVSVHYTGWLTTGKQFDSSISRGKPFSFKLGSGAVIKGWDQGVAGMKVGEKRKLVIPGALGYGASGTDGIPPNATLIFQVELLAIQ